MTAATSGVSQPEDYSETLLQELAEEEGEAGDLAAGEPVNLKDLQRALEVTEDETRLAIDALDSDYSYHRRGITLKRFGEHVQLSTRAEYAPYVERLLQPIQKQSLSQSALETLAVVAYRQQVTRLEIVGKGLQRETGQKQKGKKLFFHRGCF